MSSRNAALILSVAALVGSSLASCGSSGEANGGAGPVPLGDAAAAMDPTPVWQHFYELTQVPRTSHHEAQATAFVAEFGLGLGLETIVDGAGNVVIRKPATSGREGCAGVVLQAHLDMVPQPNDSEFDFETDPIRAFVQDGWVFAGDTTLGADDGIGVAMIMALLESDSIVHGPIEALFTTNEEDGMDGITALAPDALSGRMYVNVDNEVEGSFVISSAGGVDVDVRDVYEETPTPTGMIGYEIAIHGLIGGHSGIDIDKGRGSAHQLMARLLVEAPAGLGVRVATVFGGDTYNVIPRKATAIIAVPADQRGAVEQYVAGFGAAVRSELAATDPGVAVTATPHDLPPTVMDAAAQAALIGAVHDAPQGVYRMSAEVPGLVETSCNLGVLRIEGGAFTGGALVRSAVDSERDAHALRFAEVFSRAGASTEMHGAYASWPPNPDSPLLELMEQVYADAFGKAPVVTAVHAGLETSTAGAKFPGMDMISVGPTIENVHSPDERLQVASVPRVYELLVATLRAIE